MKKMFFCSIVLISLFIITAAVPAMAWETNSETDGLIDVRGYHESGDLDTGSYVSGSAFGSYHAEDTGSAWGNASGLTNGSGMSFDNGNFAASESGGETCSSAAAGGNNDPDITISGKITQGDWTDVSYDSSNFAYGGNTTSAEYSGTRQDPYQASGSGYANASGETVSGIFGNCGGENAFSKTQGESYGEIQMWGGDPIAQGSGQTVAGLSDSGGNGGAMAYGETNSTYSAQSPHVAGGGLEGETDVGISNSPFGFDANASVDSSSWAYTY